MSAQPGKGERFASVDSVGAALISLADTLGDDFHLATFLHRLTWYCMDLLGASGAGVMLAGSEGTLRLLSATSEETQRLELAELDTGRGPCVDAYHQGQIITHSPFDPDRPRWADLAGPAADAGFRSAYAIAMRHGEEAIGVLNVFRPTADALSSGQQRLGRMLADVATVGLLQRRALAERRDQADQLQAALTSRIVIEQAKGLLAERHDISPEEAFRRLRQHARNTNQTIPRLARDILDGFAGLPPETPPGAQRP